MSAAPASAAAVPALPFESADPADLFEVLSKLGEGSYGSVYKALDKRDGKLVAIKVLEVENEDTIELQKEINILRECDCEWIVRYKGSYRKDGNVWIVMEFCGAGSLCDLMAICERTLTEEQIAIVMKQSLYGLEYLHAKRKIHRDIKSGNILINHDGDSKLADFGVSAELATTMSKRKTVIGTPYWMAPEVLQSTEYNGKADIWSLAITAIELAVGEPPHSNVHPMRAIFLIPNSDPPTLPDPSAWSADFNDFLKVCLVKNPDKRPSATELLQSHPFILKAKSKAIIAQLVDECMQEIDEYRAQEAAEAANAAANPPAHDGTGTDGSQAGTESSVGGGGGTMSYSSGTMVHNNNNGTMVHNPGAGDTGTMRSPAAYEQGTMVFNANTMQQAAESYNSGTMLLHSSPSAAGAPAGKKPPVPAALEAASGTGTAGGARAKYEEPSYMRHIREASSKFGKGATGAAGAAGGSQTGTMVTPLPAAAAAAAAPAPLTPGDFRDLYRSGRRFTPEALEVLTAAELKQAISGLDKAQSAEKSAVEQTYSEQKKQLKQALEKKEKKK